MPEPTVALDRDDLRRTLVRIAHEIVEKNPPEGEDAPFAIVGIHRRGAVLAERLRALTGDLLGREIPFGSVDISFYRDDLGRGSGRPSAVAPVVHATQLDFPVEDRRI